MLIAAKKLNRSRSGINAIVAEVLARVFEEHPDEELTLEKITKYAVKSRKLPQAFIDGIHEKALKQALGRVLRSQKFRDDHGREIRRYHSYSLFVQGKNGAEQQVFMWRDIHDMDRSQMLVAVRERTGHIMGAVEALRADVEYWNQQVRESRERKIQLKLELG